MTKFDIEAILVKHDPIRLISIGAPLDEYESEAEMIFEAIANRNDLVSIERLIDIIHSVFVIQFDSGMAGDRDSYLAMAEEIYRG